MINPTLKFHSLAIFGAALLFLVISPYKLAFSPDSMAYMEVAENLIAGDGITNNEGNLVNHWPPLFSLLISSVALLLNLNVLQAGLISQVFLFYLFLLINMLILRQFKVNTWLILLFGLCVMLSQAFINFIYFLSEGLFLVLLVSSFYFFLKWNQTGKALNLFLSAMACGLFLLTRYAGIAFVGCYLLFILFVNKEKVAQRLKNSLKFLLTLVSVIAPWFIYQTLFESPPGGRKMATHLITVEKIQDMFITVGYWFLGSRLAIVLFIGVLIIYILKLKTINLCALTTFRTNRPIVFLILFFLFLYLLFLIVSISFYDAWTPMSNRMLSPLLGFILILFFLFFQKLWKKGKIKLVYVSIAFLLISFSSSLFPVLKNHYLYGGGYAKKVWVDSKLISFLKNLNFNTPVYSNGIELGKLHLQKDFKLLPGKNDSLKLNRLKEKIRKDEAYIVYFNMVNWRNYLVNEQTLMETFNEKDIFYFEDGFVIKKAIAE